MTSILSGLSAAQDGQFTAGQLAAMSAGQLAIVQRQDNPILAEAKAFGADGVLTYDETLKILQDVAVGGITADEFGALKTLADQMGVNGAYKTSAYVDQIFDDAVLGNSANASWHGGGAKAQALGDMTAGTTELQANELIGKWFLGTDLPGTDLSAVGTNLKSTYATCTLPLFGANGPQWSDINQGYVGDCYLMAALAETALQHPDTIKNMIKSNGNGTYSVDFIVNGKDDYVTVNADLAMMPSGYTWQNGSKQTFAHNTTNMWSQLIEKAYVQLTEQTGVTPGMTLNVNGNAYADIAGGWSNALEAVTGQVCDIYRVAPGDPTAALMTTMQNAFNAGEEVMVGATWFNISGNLIENHMYFVSGVDAAKGLVQMVNPWGQASGSATLSMKFWEPIAALANNYAAVFVTEGKPAH